MTVTLARVAPVCVHPLESVAANSTCLGEASAEGGARGTLMVVATGLTEGRHCQHDSKLRNLLGAPDRWYRSGDS